MPVPTVQLLAGKRVMPPCRVRSLPRTGFPVKPAVGRPSRVFPYQAGSDAPNSSFYAATVTVAKTWRN